MKKNTTPKVAVVATTDTQKVTLAMLVEKEASRNMGRVKDEKKLLHHDICNKLSALAKSSGFPMGVLVYIAIGKSAHKPSVFNEGYTNFNEDKAKRIIALCKAFAKHFGNDKLACNDKLVHAVDRYDNLFENKGKSKFFKECIADLPTENFKMANYKTAKELGKFIFGDNLNYNDKGYFIA